MGTIFICLVITASLEICQLTVNTHVNAHPWAPNQAPSAHPRLCSTHCTPQLSKNQGGWACIGRGGGATFLNHNYSWMRSIEWFSDSSAVCVLSCYLHKMRIGVLRAYNITTSLSNFGNYREIADCAFREQQCHERHTKDTADGGQDRQNGEKVTLT